MIHPTSYARAMHIIPGMRPTDPFVLACTSCSEVLVLREEESLDEVKCLRCGAEICGGCANQIEAARQKLVS